MAQEARSPVPEPEPPVLRLFEEFIRTRDDQEPPASGTFLRLLPDEESKRSFSALVDSFGWTQSQLPRNVQPNVVLAERFRLIEKLGAGGMGQVWLAADLKLGREVALKVLNLIGARNLDVEAAFARESEILARLNHPGIVSVIDSDEDEEHRFLVMEFVPGRSLEQLIETIAGRAENGSALTGLDLLDSIGVELPAGRKSILGAVDWYRSVAAVMAEVLMTLEAAHARGIVHRDIKPGNIMLSGGGQPMLLDFGLGGTMEGPEGDLTQSLFGTYRFVAPEQLHEARSGCDPRTDLYQMGVVLYELLTLSRAFDSDRAFVLFEAVAHGKFDLPRSIDPAIPRDLQAVVLKAMELDPSRRYATAEEFRLDLERFGRGEPVAANRGGRVAECSRSLRYWTYQRRGLLLAAAAVLLVLVSTWSVLSWMHQDFEEVDGIAELVGNRCELSVRADRRAVAFAVLVVQDGGGAKFVLPANLQKRAKEQETPQDRLRLSPATHELFVTPRGGTSLADFDDSVRVYVMLAESFDRESFFADAIQTITDNIAKQQTPGLALADAETILSSARRGGSSLEVGDREFLGEKGWESSDGSASLLSVPVVRSNQGIQVKPGGLVIFGSAAVSSRPARIDLEKLRRATPEWQTIRANGLRKGSGRYDLLHADMHKRIRRAVSAVAISEGRDCVVRRRDLKSDNGLKVMDLTKAVLGRLK